VRALVSASSVLLLCTCVDPVDAAAKKRIFSAEDPPQAVARASENLAPERVADTAEIARRVVQMGAAEATERLGAHRYQATILWEWNTGVLKPVKLVETRTLNAGAGGLSGDFSASLSNSNNQGLEVVRVNGKVYARTTYGRNGASQFRERKRDRGTAERLREETFGALRDFDQLFRGQMKLTPQGTVTFDNRLAWKYVASLGPSANENGKSLPPLVTPNAGVDATSKRRKAFFDQRKPKTLSGEVFVDAKASVVLSAKLDGRMTVEGSEAAELHLSLDLAMSNIGGAVTVSAPTSPLPDEDKPAGIAAALERFGVERASDAGVSSRAPRLPNDEPAPEDAD
jgi:hypothetical protein